MQLSFRNHFQRCFQASTIAIAVLVIAATTTTAKTAKQTSSSVESEYSVFLESPYIQWGYQNCGPVITWQTRKPGKNWSAQVQVDNRWQPLAVKERQISGPGIKPFAIVTAGPVSLPPETTFQYRVQNNGTTHFTATAKTAKSAGSPMRFVVFGDSGVDSQPQKDAALLAYNEKPDFIVVTGDLVYPAGQIEDYRKKWFPIYNADEPDNRHGAPLMRRVPMIGVAGNHDTDTTGGTDVARDLRVYPDGMAYFLNWQQPLNGPALRSGGKNTPLLLGSAKAISAFKRNAASAYPQMCNFSFDYGDTHWLVLDANFYSDWTDPTLRSWAEADLLRAQKARWRFVAFHQPGFTSDPMFATDQRMRVISPILEKYKVDMVFNGHVHHYERSYPLRFQPGSGVSLADGKPKLVPGELKMDKSFDGITSTVPDGVIYLITGGGGAKLFGQEEESQPHKWQQFTAKYLADTHSITICDIKDNTLTVRQLTTDGKEVDRFQITK
ncbi:MAG: metallophosphoesterase [Candidatus Obscuribacterales bacterium]|nr:metallophosphoesterase [Candidatus Obscuribacterales bacterium]